MKLYAANLISNYIQGSCYFSFLSIKKSPTTLSEVSKVELQYRLVTDTSGIVTSPQYKIHCTIIIPPNKIVTQQLKEKAYQGTFQEVGTITLSRKLDVAYLVSGMNNVSSEEIFKNFSNGYYGDDILNVFGDFALCNQCIAHYIPNTMLALL